MSPSHTRYARRNWPICRRSLRSTRAGARSCWSIIRSRKRSGAIRSTNGPTQRWPDFTRPSTVTASGFAVVDRAGAVRGFAIVATKRWGHDLQIHAMELDGGASWQAAIVPLLRALRQYGEQLPTVIWAAEPLREISFLLGRAHPAYDALGPELAPYYDPPYAWYLRVPDLPAFLARIAPALERRLAASPAANYTGTLKLDFYRGGLALFVRAGPAAARRAVARARRWAWRRRRLPRPGVLAALVRLPRPRRAAPELSRRLGRALGRGLAARAVSQGAVVGDRTIGAWPVVAADVIVIGAGAAGLAAAPRAGRRRAAGDRPGSARPDRRAGVSGWVSGCSAGWSSDWSSGYNAIY